MSLVRIKIKATDFQLFFTWQKNIFGLKLSITSGNSCPYYTARHYSYKGKENMNIKLISMFHKALKEGNASVNFNRVNQAAMKCGYLIHPDCCTKDVEKWIKEQSFNPNATFYKTWQDITNKNRWELALDQMVHYLTTYGTDFTMGNGYVPNENPIEISYKDFKVIMPATKEEIFEDCMGMFRSGIALRDDIISVLVEYITEYGFIDKVNLDEVKNKEAQAILSDKLKKLPNDEFGMLRCIVYRYTGKATLIKDRATINTIKGVNGYQIIQKGTVNLAALTDAQLEKLSRIFYRYKPLFLAMKSKGSTNSEVVNRIRKLARRNHKPLKKGFWETCLTRERQEQSYASLAQAESEVGNLNNYRKIQLMQAIKERLLGKDSVGKMFTIRNGKMFIREDYKAPCDVKYLLRLYKILEASVVENLKTKVSGHNVLLPKKIELTCPTSEKNFIGNIPFGSYVHMDGNHNVFGIYWRNEWGARDLDLCYLDKDGRRYNWCDSYTDGKTIVFSGDMVNADPEATELFYLGKNVADGNVGVNIFNRYRKDGDVKMKIFIADEDCCAKIGGRRTRSSDPVMCDPNNIIYETEVTFKDVGLKKVGVVANQKFFFVDLGAGDQKITTTTAAEIVQKQMSNKVESFVDLKPLLEKAGANLVYEKESDDFKCIDLSNLLKDDLIKLFA